MVRVPAHYPPYLVELVQTMIRNNEHSATDIEQMIEQYGHLEKRINGIKIQGDAPDEWWEPSSEQYQAIHTFIFEVLGPYYSMAHLTFYSEQEHGPYHVGDKEYKVFLDVGFPNFTLQLKGGKRRNVMVFVLPQHDGAKFPT
jgi:hypothetical protein